MSLLRLSQHETQDLLSQIKVRMVNYCDTDRQVLIEIDGKMKQKITNHDRVQKIRHYFYENQIPIQGSVQDTLQQFQCFLNKFKNNRTKINTMIEKITKINTMTETRQIIVRHNLIYCALYQAIDTKQNQTINLSYLNHKQFQMFRKIFDKFFRIQNSQQKKLKQFILFFHQSFKQKFPKTLTIKLNKETLKYIEDQKDKLTKIQNGVRYDLKNWRQIINTKEKLNLDKFEPILSKAIIENLITNIKMEQLSSNFTINCPKISQCSEFQKFKNFIGEQGWYYQKQKIQPFKD